MTFEPFPLPFKFSLIAGLDRSVAVASMSYVDLDLILFVPLLPCGIKPQEEDASAERVMIDVASCRKEFDGVVDCDDDDVAVENDDIDEFETAFVGRVGLLVGRRC